MENRCPGRLASAHLETTLISCPQCGRTVEIFADEARVHCRCGQWVFREMLPSCAQWCPEAERCFGTIGNVANRFNEAARAPKQAEQEQRLQELRDWIARALEACSHRGQEGEDDAKNE